MALDTRIEGIIFDFDNTLYENPPQKDDVFAQAAAKAALKLGLKMHFDEALVLARQSYKDHNSETVVFCQQFGLNEHAMIHETHDMGVEIMQANLSPAPSINQAFNLLAQSYEIAILTHGTDIWANKLLTHLGLANDIKDGRILALDHPLIAHRKKHESVDPYVATAAHMSIDPSKLAVVEDTAINLKYAHDLGMQTIFINWGKPLQEQPDYITTQVRSIEDIKPAM